MAHSNDRLNGKEHTPKTDDKNGVHDHPALSPPLPAPQTTTSETSPHHPPPSQPKYELAHSVPNNGNNGHRASQSVDLTALHSNDKQCWVCTKKFGVRRMRRKHTCRRCNHKVCGTCSSKKRYDASQDQMVRVCDRCLDEEHCIVMNHRLRNLKLKHNKRNRGTYIVKVEQASKEYHQGLVNKCKIIEINEQNVESLNAQLIADKLNTIKIPFSLTLDYTEAEIKPDQLKRLKKHAAVAAAVVAAAVLPSAPETSKHVDQDVKHEGEDDDDTKTTTIASAFGTGQLMNAHQNPHSAFYYGPPQSMPAMQYTPPVIVTGPSNNIRDLYGAHGQEPYFVGQMSSLSQGGTGVIYEESQQNDDKSDADLEDADMDMEEDEDEEDGVYEDVSKQQSQSHLMTDTGEDESDGEEETGDEDGDEEEQEDNDSHDTELLHYNESAEESSAAVNEPAPADFSKPQLNGKHHLTVMTADASAPVLHTRSQSVPSSPTVNSINPEAVLIKEAVAAMAATPEPVKTVSHAITSLKSQTPRGDKSADAAVMTTQLKLKGRARSLSHDEMAVNPTDDAVPTPMDAVDVDKQKSKPAKRSKKKQKQTQKEKRTKTKTKTASTENGHVQVTGTPTKKRVFKRQKLPSQADSLMSPSRARPPPPGPMAPASQSMYFAQRQRMELQQHIASSEHILVNPYRQFSVAFGRRPFHISLQFRNGFNSFVPPSTSQLQHSNTLTRPEYIWGWYSVHRHSHVPVGSKLLSINFQWIYDKNQQEIATLMYESPLPVTLIFEAPSYSHQIPPSIHLQLHDDEDEHDEEDNGDAKRETDTDKDVFDLVRFFEQRQSLICWWLEDGGLVLLCLLLVGGCVLDLASREYLYYQAPVLVSLACVALVSISPQKLMHLLWDFFIKVRRHPHRRRLFGNYNWPWKPRLQMFNHKRNLSSSSSRSTCVRNPNVSITDDQSLLIPNAASLVSCHTSPSRPLRKKLKKKKHLSRKTQHQSVAEAAIKEESDAECAHAFSDEHMDEFLKETEQMIKQDEQQQQQPQKCGSDAENDGDDDEKHASATAAVTIERDEESVDPEWETNICNPNGGTLVWGSFSPCTAKTLKLRGATYLTDKTKVSSAEGVLSLANIEFFVVHHNITHLAQNQVSWFHQNRAKLPRSLFFFIVHLRLDSMQASVVQYFYIDRAKFAHLLQQDEKCAAAAQENGDGYFAIGGKQFDDSGMFWNFINGPCKYRNDRLKLLARKEEGPWYMQIPTRPAILGRQVPIEYYRGYNAKHLNALKTHSTNSCAYEPYTFETLYHDPDKESAGDPTRDVPCQCGKCSWIDTNGEYPDYLELDISPEVNSVARNTVRIACPLAKSLQVEMHWTFEGQINNVELPERMLCSARLIHVDLTKIIELD